MPNDKEKKNKILVCITPQSNSARLITAAKKYSDDYCGELHILNVKKGNNILDTDESRKLLNELFDFGSEMGGIIHGLCGEDIPKTIFDFIKREEISHLVLGEAPDNTIVKSESVIDIITKMLPGIEVYIIAREAE